MPKVRNKGLTVNAECSQHTEIVCRPYFNNQKLDKQGLRKFLNDEVNINILSSHLQSVPRRKKIFDFYNQECLNLANALLGQLIVREVNGKRLSGIIAEVECYLGNEDVASHSYKGKRTPRNEPMFMKPSTAYVYSIYGMYHCFNISSKEDGSCVLIRALEPLEGIEEMHPYRQERRQANSKKLKNHHLCNGPSKLCQALNIKKETCNKLDLSESQDLWLEDGVTVNRTNIVVSKRIGINSAGEEWANKPLRFYIHGNPHVSVKDQAAEEMLRQSVSLRSSGCSLPFYQSRVPEELYNSS